MEQLGSIFGTITGKTIGASVLTVITGIVGGWDMALQVLCIVIVIDVVTGILKGFVNEGVRSKRIREGLVTKSAYFLVVILAYQIDLLLDNEAPIIRTVVVYLYILTEATSILENSYDIGIPIPKKLVEFLQVVKEKSGGSASQEDFENLKK